MPDVASNNEDAGRSLFLKELSKNTKTYKYLKLRHTLSPLFLRRNLSYLRKPRSKFRRLPANIRQDLRLEDLLARRHAVCVCRKFSRSSIQLEFTSLQLPQVLVDTPLVHLEVELKNNKRPRSRLIRFNSFLPFHWSLEIPSYLIKVPEVQSVSEPKSVFDESTSPKLPCSESLSTPEVPIISRRSLRRSSVSSSTTSEVSDTTSSSNDAPKRRSSRRLNPSHPPLPNGSSTYVANAVESPKSLKSSPLLRNVSRSQKKTSCLKSANSPVNPSIRISADSLVSNGHPPEFDSALFTILLSKQNIGHLFNSLEDDEPVTKRLRSTTSNSNAIGKTHTPVFQKMIPFNCELPRGEIDLLLPTTRGELSLANSTGSKLDKKISNEECRLRFNLSFEKPATSESRTSTSNGAFISRQKCSSGKKLVPVVSSTSNLPQRQSQNIYFRFRHNGTTGQHTELHNTNTCPWCQLACPHLYGLLKHLRCCHPRFTFVYKPHPHGCCIDVGINNFYDGSLEYPRRSTAKTRVKLRPFTSVIVYRRKKRPFRFGKSKNSSNNDQDLREFMDADTESDFDNDRISSFAAVHQRPYYHTDSVALITADEFDEDSEEENDPPWLHEITEKMIDEFTDVNVGEKSVMKLWNSHVMHYNFLGDCHMPLACETFVRDHGLRIVKEGHVRNLLLHFCLLGEQGLISRDVIVACMKYVHNHEGPSSKSKACRLFK